MHGEVLPYKESMSRCTVYLQMPYFLYYTYFPQKISMINSYTCTNLLLELEANGRLPHMGGTYVERLQG